MSETGFIPAERNPSALSVSLGRSPRIGQDRTLLGVVICLYVVVQSVQVVQMLTTTGQRSVIARIPMNLMYASVVLGFAFATLFPVLEWLGARPGADHRDVER